MLRFSISTLLVVIFIAALASAALVNCNETWKQVMVTMTMVTLTIYTIASLAADNRRPFAVGFAVAGWIYLLIVFVSAIGLRNDLLTDKATSLLFDSIHGKEEVSLVQTLAISPSGNYLAAGSDLNRVTIWDTQTGQKINSIKRYAHFSDIGHSVWTLIVACLGGVCAELFCRRKQNDGAETGTPTGE